MASPRRRSIRREFQTISRSLIVLSNAFARLGPVLDAAARNGNGSVVKSRNLSPQRRAQLKLQGSYIGHLRKLRVQQRTQVKKLRDSKGVSAAIRLARELSSR